MFGLFLKKYLKDNMSEVAKLDAPTLRPLFHEDGGPVWQGRFAKDLCPNPAQFDEAINYLSKDDN